MSVGNKALRAQQGGLLPMRRKRINMELSMSPYGVSDFHNALNPHSNPVKQLPYSHLIDEETEEQRNEVRIPRW